MVRPLASCVVACSVEQESPGAGAWAKEAVTTANAAADVTNRSLLMTDIS
jgi:hypothetical protein